MDCPVGMFSYGENEPIENSPFGNLLVTSLYRGFDIARVVTHSTKHDRFFEGSDDENGIVSTAAGYSSRRTAIAAFDQPSAFSVDDAIVFAVCRVT